ncbi:MAG: MATE family efflux transporter, partial [Candidatus Krumholzibacteria bacterium]|nr:MATE family efflux transporter [Candidatus Krumholzibacteria bacterium]
LHVTVLAFGSLGVGTQAITARRLGEKRFDEYPRIVRNAFALALAVGIPVSIAGCFLSPWIFSKLAADPAVVREGIAYMSIRFGGLFCVIAMMTLGGFAYGAARVKIDMIVSVAVNGCHILLNYLLIFGHAGLPRLEVRGAAIASVISTGLGLLLYLSLVRFRILGRLPAPLPRARLSRSLMARIVRISGPRAVQSVTIAGFLVFLSLIGRIGVGELAISNIIIKAFDVSFMIGLSIGTASATLVGRSLGERNPALAVRFGWHSAAIGSLAMGIIGASFILFPREIMSVFTGDLAAIEKGVVPFRILGAFQFIDAVGIILSRTLQGVGGTLYVMIAEIACMGGVLVPFTYASVEIFHAGLLVTWFAIYLYIVCFAGAMAWKFREGGWKRIEI